MHSHNARTRRPVRPPTRSKAETDPLALEIGERVFEARTRRGMKGVTLAAALEVPPSALTAWERGRVVPSVRTLLALAKALRVGPTELLPGTDRVSALEERIRRLPAAARPDLERLLDLLERAYPRG